MKQKLLFYIDSMQLGGAQRVMANLVEYFADTNTNVVLVNDIYPADDIPEYTINDRVKRIFLTPMSGNVLKKNIRRIIELRKIIKREKPDAIISFLGPPNIRAIIASRYLKTKTIVSVRNDPAKEYGSKIRKIITKFLFLLPDGCVFQTADAQDYFFPATKKKSSVILNPVRETFFELDWSPQKNEIVVVGRLEQQKNPFLAIDAFLKSTNLPSAYKLVFYGDGSLRNQMDEYIKKHHASDKVELRGRIENVEKVLSESLLFLLTSDYEGLPNALMEAIAVGIPCISTDCPCGGPRELLKNAKDFQLQRCNDADGFAHAISKLLNNRDLQMECSSIEKVQAQRFKPETVLSQWKEYVEKI